MHNNFQKTREGDVRLNDKAKAAYILKNWLSDIGYNKPVGHYLDVINQDLEIYTTNPEQLIGERRVNVENLTKLLHDEFNGYWTVKFIEIRGSFVLANPKKEEV